ncbi:nucleoside triphosphate pyrophosphohydrolase family protein [Polaromonas sp.]|uniref:nucleoside triphosphate pyrophosphohydrolase family protein n=1 Tax=Polaromonas sp. TaxID=1869339 RepID=UPI001A261485|nr:nucleoside triphosphate pyrophosphohydrolase family protein [Burkholderiales bacterium]
MVKASAQQLPLTIEQYAAKANETDRFADIPGGSSKLTFGFFGEVGGLLAALKKVYRDQLLESETEVAGEEIGDALWYLVAMATAQGVNPQILGIGCLTSLRKRFNECDHDGQSVVNFRQIDGIIDVHGSDLAASRIELLGELARMSGEVVGHGSQPQLALNHSQAGLLGQLLAILGLVCASFMLKLEDVARDNLFKIHGRWPGPNRAYWRAFDGDLLEHEQLPRVLPMEFIEREASGKTYVVQRLNRVHIGDRLTDNSNEPDDYRFHDVFHLAYVAHLGWSPVIRALLKIKRKSKPAIDENEDGARAMIIEEGIATWIFNHAKKRRFYEDVEPGKLDYGLLKQVHSMVSGYEVEACPLWQWEQAILEGFRVFRELRKSTHRGGTVTVNMIDHTLTFKPPSKTLA